MRKFELIQEYPGSPKLGYIAKETTNIDKVNFITQDIVNYPKFWREIIPLDYQIISILSDGRIYSVRRLSDNLVMCLNDTVYLNFPFNYEQTLDEIKIEFSKCIIVTNHSWNYIKDVWKIEPNT